MTIEHVAGQDARSEWADDRDRSRLHWLRDTATGKQFYVLRQRGAFPDLCYDHGRLLGPWIDKGVFPEILDTIAVDTDLSIDALDIVPKALIRRITEDIDRASSAEMQEAIRALHAGFADSGAIGDYNLDAVRLACLAIDSGNIATGFMARVERWGSDWPDEEIDYLRGALAGYPGIDPSLVRRSNRGLILTLLQRVLLGAPGMGCTGIWAGPGRTEDGAGLHGRTFDGAFFSWNNVPGIHLFDERAVNPGWRRYAAIGTVGLVYPGGISGMNDTGIACSLHQMSTTTYSTGTPGGGWDIAPFVQQRILREAASIDQAVAIAREARHFASWAIVVSDAKTGRAATIEVNGRADADGGQRVEVLRHGETGVQSNHFRTDALAEAFEHFEDAHFTKSLGKWLETRSRTIAAGERLELLAGTGQLGTGSGLQILAGHHDGQLPKHSGAFPVRAFGRTVCKAYGLMASIARTDPDRTRAQDRFWFTLGDRLPGPHSAMAGFDIDWERFRLTHRPATLAARSLSDGQVRGLEHYLAAHEAHVRPRKRDVGGGGEDYVGRALTTAETMAGLRTVRGHLDDAVAAWRAETGEPEFPLLYIRARVLHALGTEDGLDQAALLAARAGWDELLQVVESIAQTVPVHDYEKLLVWLYAAATDNALGNRDRARERIAKAEAMRDRLRDRPGGEHPGLSKLMSLAYDISARGTYDAGGIDFVTVE